MQSVRDDLSLSGTAAGDVLKGDLIDLGSYDTLSGLDGNDTLLGLAGNDTLLGGNGNDTLTGGAGYDNLNGGTGLDTLVISAAVGTSSDSGRAIVTGLNNDKGQDTLTSFSLTEDTIKVVATNVASFVHGTDTNIGAGTGTEVSGNRASFSTATGLIELNQTTNDNWADVGDIAVTFATPSVALTEANFEARLQYSLTGTTAANTLTGGKLNDTLSGGDGNDVLTGGASADNLNGGTGLDTLVINAVVGTSSDSGRAILTGVNNDKGQDTLTSFSLTEDTIKVIATNVASFVHGTDTSIGAGTGAEVSGNRASFSTATGLIELNQTTNDNWADVGDIAISFATPSVALTEANFEARLQYQLTGTAGSNTLTGGKLSDILTGGAGADNLSGGLGADTLVFNAGLDKFVFSKALGSTNIDKITDFVVADDTIQLENSIFTKFGTTTLGAIGSTTFTKSTTGLAADSNDYIIYETDTGKLFYDADGSGTGASVQIALLGTNLLLTNADFLLV